MSTPYPESPRGDHADVYRDAEGREVRVPDPYRWLEDPDSPETRRWVQAQNERTEDFLSALPARAAYRERLTALWDYPRDGLPWERGGRYFRSFNPGLLAQPVLQTADSPSGPWRDLLDPNGLSGDGTVALMGASVSRDGARLAYATQSGGSDWLTWQVRDVASGQDVGGPLRWSKFSGAAWLPDGSGFFYSAYDAPGEGEALTGANRNQRLMFHRLGTAQGADELVLSRPDQPDWGFSADVTDDGAWLVVQVWLGTSPKNLLWVRPLGEHGPGSGDFQPLVDDFRAMFQVVGSDGDTLYLHTDEDAPLGKLTAWNIRTGERRDLIAQGVDKLEQVLTVPGGFLTVTLRDASHRLTLHDRAGQRQREIELPTLGTVMVSARQSSAEVFVAFTSFLQPTRPYRLELPGGALEPLADPALNFDAGAYEVTQEFAVSKDGTRVPMFIVARKGAPRDGSNRTLLYGYGGFGISLTPAFSASRLAWLERGGVFVQANLRGGGEYGESWHEAGTLERKQNVFDDFAACAEHLTRQGWTRPERLAIQGGSNGGLLVGASITQRPELFGAAVAQVGVLDMLRYHLFTIGWAWASDYGRSDDPDMFATLLAYSPLHNLTEGTRYPATLITTGDHDDRVVPAHSYKFAAELQRVQSGEAPTLIRIQTRGGHGAGKPTALLIEEAADIWAFLEGALAGEAATEASFLP